MAEVAEVIWSRKISPLPQGEEAAQRQVRVSEAILECFQVLDEVELLVFR